MLLVPKDKELGTADRGAHHTQSKLVVIAETKRTDDGFSQGFPPNALALERPWGTQEDLVGAEGFLLLLFGVNVCFGQSAPFSVFSLCLQLEMGLGCFTEDLVNHPILPLPFLH